MGNEESNAITTSPVRRAVFPLLALTLLILVGVSAWAFDRLQKHWRVNNVHTLERNVESFMGKGLSAEVDVMTLALNSITNDAELLFHLKNRDREQLFSSSLDYYKWLRERYEITHFYFHDVEGVNIVRVHTPDHHDDEITRLTMNRAASTKSVSHGLELGPYGFVLRVVQPVVHQGILIGYVELGREIDNLLQHLEQSLQIQLTPLIKKSKLNYEKWKHGNLLFERTSVWDHFPNYAALGGDKSLDRKLATLWQKSAAPHYILKKSPQGEVLSYSAVPLSDMSGETVGRLVISENVTALEQRFQYSFATMLALLLLLSGALLLLSRRFLAKIDDGLFKANSILKHAHDELDERVKTRTRELTEEIAQREATEIQLRQAQKMETVGQLTGGIAHDFNNLLTVIIGSLDLLRGNVDKPMAKELAEDALRSAEKAGELTQRLLAFSRRQVLQPRSLDPARVLGNLEGLFQRALGETIVVRLSIPADIWPCFADTAQVESALLNLAVNARDAMPGGGELVFKVSNLTVSPSLDGELPPGEYVVFTVCDSGMGMPDVVIDQAFEPFFTTKDVGTGTGLGLSMVYGFAKQSGGHASIHSQIGRGTEVRLFLPRSTEAAAEDTIGQKSLLVTGKGERILVVEDDKQVLHFACQMLNKLGYKTYSASSAAEALSELKEHSDVELLFSDIVLPGGVSGTELAHDVAKRYPQIPILLASGYAGGSLEGTRELDVMEKPYRRETLAPRIAAALHAKSKKAPLTPASSGKA